MAKVSEMASVRLLVGLFRVTVLVFVSLLLLPQSSWGDEGFPKENAVVKAARKVSP
jgi:hypothetical protein